MRKDTIIAVSVTGLAILGAVGISTLTPKDITLENPQKLVWEKPTTDEEWNEDVKLEYVHIRSTEVLKTMQTNQTLKLEKNIKAFSRYEEMKKRGLDPVDVLYVEIKDQLRLSYPEMSEEELDKEAQAGAETKYNQELWEIEKITQGIERVNKEIELREKGFVVVEGESTGLFGSFVPPERIRQVID